MTPDESTIKEFYLAVGDDHELYVHDWGNKDAEKVIIFLHGGPGAACTDSQKQFYDPKVQRVIFFDQRGAGKSKPTGGITNNTTQDLVEDISRIADKLSLAKFILHGRSWGSCLSLYYAIKYPGRVIAILTGGIFLGTKHELDFDDRGDRYKTFFPDVWHKFLEATPKNEHEAPITYHLKRVINSSGEDAKKSAFIYSKLILGVLRLDDRARLLDFATFDITSTKVEAHYKLNNCFLEDNLLMKHAGTLTVPVWIIQGRYDIMCVPKIAYELHKALPNSHLSWVSAGHSGSDRAVYDVSRMALNQLVLGQHG
jgi:proline iminopeptidase